MRHTENMKTEQVVGEQGGGDLNKKDMNIPEVTNLQSKASRDLGIHFWQDAIELLKSSSSTLTDLASICTAQHLE